MTLNNTSFVKFIDVLGEGEIAGFATPAKSGATNLGLIEAEQFKDVFVENTPIVRSGATLLAGTYEQADSNGIRSGTYTITEELVTITTFSNHGFQEEDTVTLTASTGDLEDGVYSVEEKISSTQFTVLNKTGEASSGGQCTATGVADEITVTTEAVHGFKADQKIVIVPGSGDSEISTLTLKSVTQTTFTADSPNENLTSGQVGVAKKSDFNFSEVDLTLRTGTTDQGFVEGFDQIESETAVGVKVEKVNPVTRTLTNPNIDAVRVRVQVPALSFVKSNGSIVGTSIKLRIDVSENGGSFLPAIADTIKGKTNKPYERDYEIDLRGKVFPVSIKVNRLTKDSASTKIQHILIWASFVSLIDGRLRYPHTAYTAIRLSAKEFQSIPQRAYRIRGRKVRIPSNATVDNTNGRLTYDGVWNGTFATERAWTSDPAWCLFDLLTDYRAGFGDQIETSQLDKFAFFTASKYSSELVNDFKGGTEPRFSCNFNFNTQQDAYKAIGDLCSVFRAMPYWAAGTLEIAQDSPADPIFIFSLANVGPEGFSYSAASQKTRPSVALVKYLDLETRKEAYEQVEDADAIRRFGIVTKEIEAIACTSRSQARRVGEWLLYTENVQTEIVTFSTDMGAGAIIRPGDIIEVSDPVRTSSRRGGRIKSATTTAVTVDDFEDLPSSGGSLSVLLPDGTLEKKAVSGHSSGVITVSDAFSVAPNANSFWLWEVASSDTQQYRVIAISEDSDTATYGITALKHDAGKYAAIETGQSLQGATFVDLQDPPDAPTGLTVTEELYTYQSEVRAKIDISWESVDNAAQYLVRYAQDDGNFIEDFATGTSYEILNITPGEFEIEVFAQNGALTQSNEAATATFTALGKTAPPADVTNFTATLDPDGAVTLSWDKVADLDLQGYVIYQSTVYGSGTLVGEFLTTQAKLGKIAIAGSYTWTIKALDTSGNESTNAASATVIAGTPGNFLNAVNTDSTLTGGLYVATDYIADADEYVVPDTHTGIIDGVIYIPIDAADNWTTHFTDQGANTLQELIDAGYDQYLLPSLDSGTYTEVFDLGSTISGVIVPTITTSAYSGSATESLLISTSADNVTYTDHTGQSSVFASNFRYVKVAYTFTTTGNNDVTKITALNLKVSSEIKTEIGEATYGSESGGVEVALATSFNNIKSVVVTPEASTASVTAVVNSVGANNDRFNASVYDTASGNRDNQKFTYIVQGT
jgi:predicted phage tail protein|tara:strand:+ start:893 stop:4531 length:3639 start_codon:yes stop_codon:yes gene_type:complete